MAEKHMNYKKYTSNGDLPELNDHRCICCGVAEQDMEIFVFFGKINEEETPFIIPENVVKKPLWVGSTTGGVSQYTPTTTTQYTSPSGLQYPIFRPGGGELVEPHYNRKKRHQIFLCAECLYKLSQKISPDTIAKWVIEKV